MCVFDNQSYSHCLYFSLSNVKSDIPNMIICKFNANYLRDCALLLLVFLLFTYEKLRFSN